MRKLTALAVALTFVGITFAQPGRYAPPPPHHHHHTPPHHHRTPGHIPPPPPHVVVVQPKLGTMQAGEIRGSFRKERVLGKEPKL